MEISPYSILIIVALGLMVVVSGGVAYLTVAEWRDRRRREEELRSMRSSTKSSTKSSSTKSSTKSNSKRRK